MTKYLFPEELRKFGFVPYEEWEGMTLPCREYRSCFMSNGTFRFIPNEDISNEDPTDLTIIAVQVSPVPCEKVKVWRCKRGDSFGIKGEHWFYRSGQFKFGFVNKTDAQAHELCDLLERQEG